MADKSVALRKDGGAKRRDFTTGWTGEIWKCPNPFHTGFEDSVFDKKCCGFCSVECFGKMQPYLCQHIWNKLKLANDIYVLEQENNGLTRELRQEALSALVDIRAMIKQRKSGSLLKVMANAKLGDVAMVEDMSKGLEIADQMADAMVASSSKKHEYMSKAVGIVEKVSIANDITDEIKKIAGSLSGTEIPEWLPIPFPVPRPNPDTPSTSASDKCDVNVAESSSAVKSLIAQFETMKMKK